MGKEDSMVDHDGVYISAENQSIGSAGQNSRQKHEVMGLLLFPGEMFECLLA